MPWSQAICNSALDHYTGKASWTQPSAVYLGLSSTTPTSTGGNVTEPSSGSYARVQVTSAQFTSASGASTATNTDKEFPTATADWLSGADLTYLVVYDAASAGNFIGYEVLQTAKPVTSGDTAKFSSGELTITIS